MSLGFDVDGFLGRYSSNLKRIKELYTERNAIADSISIQYGTERTSGGGLPSSQVESRVLKREKLNEDIKELQAYFKEYLEVMNLLQGDELIIATEYFVRKKKSKADVERLAYRLYLSDRTVYRKIKSIRRTIKEYKK